MCSPGTVLVVDDDAAVRSALKFGLEAEGFQVRVFATAEALLAEPRPDGPACVVIDYRMPSIDGLQLFEVLQARGWDTPAILITGRANRQLLDVAARLGIDRVLEKPLSDGALVEGIRESFRRQGA